MLSCWINLRILTLERIHRCCLICILDRMWIIRLGRKRIGVQIGMVLLLIVRTSLIRLRLIVLWGIIILGLVLLWVIDIIIGLILLDIICHQTWRILMLILQWCTKNLEYIGSHYILVLLWHYVWLVIVFQLIYLRWRRFFINFLSCRYELWFWKFIWLFFFRNIKFIQIAYLHLDFTNCFRIKEKLDDFFSIFAILIKFR